MKTEMFNNDDAPLRELLKEWKPEVSLPPGFQEQVWRRIERTEVAAEPSITLATVFTNWITNLLPKPALATAYMTVLFIVGASAGWSQARQESDRVTGELGTRYAEAVDPYQSARQP